MRTTEDGWGGRGMKKRTEGWAERLEEDKKDRRQDRGGRKEESYSREKQKEEKS